VAEVEVLKVDSAGSRSMKDPVTEEVPLTVYLNGKEFVTLSCSPADLKDLAIGFLYSSGLISSAGDISRTVIDESNWAAYVELKDKEPDLSLAFKRMYTSGCGRGTLFYNALDLVNKKRIESDFKVSSRSILKMMASFQGMSVAFKETGGVHSTGLSDGREILIFREDIGRHNALDKAIGAALIMGLDMKGLMALGSGRISSEIVLKARRAGLPVLASRSAPTDQALKIAEASGLTVVGFARGSRMNVYTEKERIAGG